MKTRYRFIHFNDWSKPGSPKWDCCNNKTNAVLGSCTYYAPWRQWVFTQSGPGVVFSADCLRDIAHFMEQLPKP